MAQKNNQSKAPTKAPEKPKSKPLPNILPDEEVPQELLAKALIQISQAAEKLVRGPLSKRCVYALIKDASGGSLSLGVIEQVLELASELEERYVDKEFAKKVRAGTK